MDIDSVFEFVEPKNQMDEATLFSNANDKFYQKYKNITNIQDFKLNIDYVRHACNIVENLYEKTSHKTAKKTLVIEMLKNCLLKVKNVNYTEDELKIVNQTIESLHSQKKIKKIRVSKRLTKSFLNFFLKYLGL